MAEWGDIEQREKKWYEEEPIEEAPQGKNEKDTTKKNQIDKAKKDEKETAKLYESKMKQVMQDTL